MNTPMMRASNVAEWLDLPVHRVYELVRQRRIPCVRIGRQVRFDPEALRSWAAAGGTDSGEVQPEAA